jgi:hypothetical protein
VVPYAFKWEIDGATNMRQNTDTISVTFISVGTHNVKVSYLDGSDKAKATTSIYITANKRVVSDTVSHEFGWTEMTIPSENDMTGCWVFEPNDIWAVNGNLHEYDGSRWHEYVAHTADGKQYPMALSGYSIFGFSDHDMWLTDGSLILHHLGEGLIEKISTYYLSHASLHNAWGAAPGDLYFVGDSGTIIHYDGTNWMQFPKITSKNLYSVWGTSGIDVWASGYNTSTAESELLHFDGQKWSKDILSSSGDVSKYGVGSVFAVDSAGHRSTTVSGSAVLRKTDDGTWRADVSVPNGDHIGMNVYGAEANDVFAIGSWGLVCHWNGKTWRRYDQFFEPSNPSYLPHQASMKGNTVAVVGVKNGTSWILVGQRK